MSGVHPKLAATFLDEAREIVDKLYLGLEAVKSGKSKENASVLEELLRNAHNLKGAASWVEAMEISRRCHAVETAFQPFSKGDVPIPPEVPTRVSEDLAAIESLIATFAKEQTVETAVQESASSAERTSAADGRSTIRVETERFDYLMGFTGELLASQSRMNVYHQKLFSFLEQFQNIVSASKDRINGHEGIITSARTLVQEGRNNLMDFGRLVSDMNSAMKHLRMVPLRIAEPEWRRVVRNAAEQTQKQVTLHVESGDIELDKHVLDHLRDPMVHLLRNAVDHGIELPETRQSMGKSHEGGIFVKAGVKGTSVRITIQDDGIGIDSERVLKQAVRRNLLKMNDLDSISKEDVFEMLFRPGFSTTDRISEISGRGIGLDVVRTRIKELGGNVFISESIWGKGTVFVLSIPFSILSTLGLLVRSGTTTFAIAVDHIDTTFRVKDEQIHCIDGNPVVVPENENPIRVLYLSDLIGQARSKGNRWNTIVVISSNGRRLGLAVDHIEGQQEFVTKALPRNFKQVQGVNGAVIQPDGRVAVSLDIPYLFEYRDRTRRESLEPSAAGRAKNAQKKVLVVDDSMAARALAQTMLTDAGYNVTLASDGFEAMEKLKSTVFDLIVSDVKMPRMDGFALTKAIREDNALREIPVILITSLDSPDGRAKGAAAGADEYVIKGTFDRHFIVDLVARYI